MGLFIITMTPFALDRNLGAAYNAAMALLPADGWACFLDHDAMFTTRDWYRQLHEAIAAEPRALFTGVTNRIASPWQRAQETDVNNHDVLYHRKIGAARQANRSLLDVTDANGIGGVVLCLSKAAWLEVGGFVDGMFCVDHNLHFAFARAGRPVYVIEGLYLYHFRRGDGVRVVEEPKAPCICRGREAAPTRRVTLPEAV